MDVHSAAVPLLPAQILQVAKKLIACRLVLCYYNGYKNKAAVQAMTPESAKSLLASVFVLQAIL